MRWSVIPSPLQDYCRNYSRRCNRNVALPRSYRQLVSADKPGLVLDIAPLSENDLAFYCLDVTRAGDNGVLAALLLRALFNGLLQEQLAHRGQRLPEMGSLLKQVNQLLRQANLPGQFLCW